MRGNIPTCEHHTIILNCTTSCIVTIHDSIIVSCFQISADSQYTTTNIVSGFEGPDTILIIYIGRNQEILHILMADIDDTDVKNRWTILIF